MSRDKRRTCVLETLPDGVLLVLARWLTVYQLWTLTNTCHTMRQRLRNFPVLWNSFQTKYIINKAGPRDTIARAIVHLTGQPPARLNVCGPFNIPSRSLFSLMKDWISTLEVLHAHFYVGAPNSSDYQPFAAITDALSKPAPHLDTLDLSIQSNQIHSLPISFLGATVGSLRRCSLANVHLNLSAMGLYPALSTVTTLGLSYTGTAGHSIDANDLQTLLDSLPLLENFAHTFRRLAAIVDGSTTPTLRLPSRLKYVYIDNPGSGPVEIASAFGAVPTMTIAGVDPALYPLFPGDIHLHLPKQSRMRIRFLHGNTGAQTVTMLSPIHQATPSVAVRFLVMNAPTTARVTRVQLHEWQWHTLIALPTFPQLEELCIVLASCSEYDPRVHDGVGFVFLSSIRSPHIAQFTSLRQLELYSGSRYWDIPGENEACARPRRALAGVPRWQGSSRTCHSHLKCPLSLDGVGDLVSWMIGPDRRLNQLILGGITDIVDGDPATALGRLEAMTETIEVMQQPPRDIVRECQLGTRDNGLPGARVFDCFSFDDDFSWKDSIDP